MKLRKLSKDLEFENFNGISSLVDFEFAAQSLLRLPSSFPSQLVFLLVIQEKEYMKLDVGKVIDSMTQESCIPTDSMKSGDDHPNFVHNTGVGAYTDLDKTNPTYLVGLSYEMPVGNI